MVGKGNGMKTIKKVCLITAICLIFCYMTAILTVTYAESGHSETLESGNVVRVGFATEDGSEVSESFKEVAKGSDFVLPDLSEVAEMTGFDYGTKTLDHWAVWWLPPTEGTGNLEWNSKRWGESGISDSGGDFEPQETGKPGDTINPVYDIIIQPVFAGSAETGDNSLPVWTFVMIVILVCLATVVVFARKHSEEE